MSRFDFIKQKDNKLYSLCLQVENRRNDDADVFMLKCRRALECIVTIAGSKGRNLYEKVYDINNNLKISAEMKHKIFDFKDMCNESIHFDEEEGEDVNVSNVIDRLVEICQWLVDAIIDKQVKNVISSNVETVALKTRELQAAFMRNDSNAIEKLTEEIKRLSQKQKDDINYIKTGEVNSISNIENVKTTTRIIYSTTKPNGYMKGFKRGNKNVLKTYTNADIVNLYNTFKEVKNTTTKQDIIDRLYDAAYQGNYMAKINLLNIFYYGQGVPKNYSVSFQIANELALKGHAEIQYLLGDMYLHGHGIPKDIHAAIKWYQKAGTQGIIDAQKNAVFLLRSLSDNKVDKLCENCINYSGTRCHKGLFEDTCTEFKPEIRCCKCCKDYKDGTCSLFNARTNKYTSSSNYFCYKFEYHKIL